MNRAPFLALSAAAALALSACSEASYTPPPPPERDEAEAAALPTGSYTVTGVATLGGEKFSELVGYVDFGTEVDGADCASDYSITVTADAGKLPVRALRPARGEYYRQEVTDAAGADEWFTGLDMPAAEMLFVPFLVANAPNAGVTDDAGLGNLCSIPVMPRFMNFADGVFTTDPGRTMAAYNTVWGRSIVGMFTGSAARQAAEDMYITEPYEFLVAEIALAENPDGGFTLTQTRPSEDDEDNVVLVFTPAPKRTITTPAA